MMAGVQIDGQYSAVFAFDALYRHFWQGFHGQYITMVLFDVLYCHLSTTSLVSSMFGLPVVGFVYLFVTALGVFAIVVRGYH